LSGSSSDGRGGYAQPLLFFFFFFFFFFFTAVGLSR